MRATGLKFLMLGAMSMLVAGVLAGCENPFDPINKSDKIQGLSYIDFSSTWDRWDSDPEYDGVTISLEYYNEFGNSLNFRDKPHDVVIEFWTTRDTEAVDPTTTTGTTTATTTTTTASLIGRTGLWGARSRNAGNAPHSVLGLIVQEKLWFSKTIRYSNSEDDIRIPIEAYARFLPECAPVTTTVGAGTITTTPEPSECEQKGFLLVRAFPPQGYPRPELVVAQPDVIFFKPVIEENTPNL